MLFLRNAVLEADFAKKGFKLPKARKTGTTIAGVVYKVSLDRPTEAVTHLLIIDHLDSSFRLDLPVQMSECIMKNGFY